MIHISRQSVDDPGDSVRLRNYQVTGDYDSTARISRTKTLDGGGVLSHYGTSVTDRDFKVEARLSETEATSLKALHENGVLALISFWEGVFSGYIYHLKVTRDGKTEITFYFKEKLT